MPNYGEFMARVAMEKEAFRERENRLKAEHEPDSGIRKLGALVYKTALDNGMSPDLAMRAPLRGRRGRVKMGNIGAFSLDATLRRYNHPESRLQSERDRGIGYEHHGTALLGSGAVVNFSHYLNTPHITAAEGRTIYGYQDVTDTELAMGDLALFVARNHIDEISIVDIHTLHQVSAPSD